MRLIWAHCRPLIRKLPSLCLLISGNKFLEGYIVATKLDKMGVGITDIVYIDKGWEHGVHAGDVFEVYYIPEIEKKTATAVIVQNNYDMHVGNKIRSKR